MRAEQPMLECRSLALCYGETTVLSGLDWSLARGHSCALIGPSGCGKSTLLRALAGLKLPAEGELKVAGALLTGVRKDSGLILQSGGLLPWKNLLQNTDLALRVRGVPRAQRERRVQDMLTELGLWEHRRKYPAQLSGGQRQRAAIARTLVLQPDLLLMDEAFSALDALNRELLQNLLLALFRRYHFTLVFVTHSIEEAVFLGQHILVMSADGQLKQLDNPYMGDARLREKAAYYELCSCLREELRGGAHD